jgi:hypothetical protein
MFPGAFVSAHTVSTAALIMLSDRESGVGQFAKSRSLFMADYIRKRTSGPLWTVTGTAARAEI